ncbi:hypothetical protein GA0074692_6702 [Micromonospora pallida]|uniref:Uncharacterized protein n=1 Tax=Micromonospora pallida TaxID=145854 RepID=A0A1C6TKA4_9ACTN|nr:hypothetical protein GA0074692_6702 [Micromonospora pallida]
MVCREYDIAPRRATVAEMKANPKVRAFYGHNDMRLAWGGTSHTDPVPTSPGTTCWTGQARHERR